MSDSEGATSPNDNDAILQHVMALIDDDENGATFKIIKSAGVKRPLDILMCSSGCALPLYRRF